MVEDDADLRETLADVLSYEGFQVRVAAHGQEAVALMSGPTAPSLVLLDLMMPVMNGWDFRTQQLRNPNVSEVPVVIMSAAAGARQQAVILSAQGYLQKPIDVEALISLVHRYLD